MKISEMVKKLEEQQNSLSLQIEEWSQNIKKAELLVHKLSGMIVAYNSVDGDLELNSD